MAKVKIFNQMSNIGSAEDFQRFISALVSDVVQKFNGSLSFVENIRASGSGNKNVPSEPLSVTFINSTDVQRIPHSLRFVPNGFIVVKLDAAETLYAPTGSSYAWTSDTIYLQASDAVTASIYIV